MNKEINFLKKYVPLAFTKYATKVENIERKSKFDLVTAVDKNIEKFLIEKINEFFPNDRILSEEINNTTIIRDRTWTIDPIDGTLNMVHSIKLFGVQLALIENMEVIVSYIYFPHTNDEYYAIKNLGSFLNNKKIIVDKNVSYEDAIVSFGDYTHKDLEKAHRQHKSIGEIYSKIAKIRMFGTAALDFSLVASGSTSACVVITKNLWDILPGYLLAKEAGAILVNLNGDEYNFGDDGLIATANIEIKDLLIDSLR